MAETGLVKKKKKMSETMAVRSTKKPIWVNIEKIIFYEKLIVLSKLVSTLPNIVNALAQIKSWLDFGWNRIKN